MAEQPESTSVPWDTSLGNRFSHYSAENHSAPLWIAALLGLTYVLGMLLVRAFLKWRVFGWDDSAMVLGTIFASLQSILILNALRAGLGEIPRRATDLPFVGKLVFSSRILLVLSLYLAKLSVLYLLRRIFVRDQKRITLLCDIIIGFTVTGGLISILITGVGCPTSNFFVEHCQNQATRWIIVATIDMFTELLAFLLPIYLVWQLQMRVETKLRVIAAFSFRLIVLALCVVHLYVWISYTRGAPSPFSIVPSLVWQQVLLATSLIAATIPNLKAFLQSLSASWGGAQFGYTTKAYGNGTFEMANIGSTAASASRRGTNDMFSSKGGSRFEAQTLTSNRPSGRRASLGSGGSQDLIIRKETVFTVERT